jgi:hypothetical protein
MKFIILIFALLLSIKLCLKKILDKKILHSIKNNPSQEITFLENKIKFKTENEKKNLISSRSKNSNGYKGYKMKITIFKETDNDKSEPTILKGIVKLGKAFEIYGINDEFKNQFSFLK